MSTDYTQVFGDFTITPSATGYLAYTLSQNTQLFWPSPGNNIPAGSVTEATVSAFNNINATVSSKTLSMPDATKVSTGTAVVFTNVGSHSFTVLDNSGGTIVPLPTGTSFLIYLTDNTTAAGAWTNVPYAAGVTAVTSVALTSASNNIVVGGSPIISAGTLTLTLANNLLSIAGLDNTSLGMIVHDTATTFSSRTITGTANQITVTNGTGVSGNPTISLPNPLVIGAFTANGIVYPAGSDQGNVESNVPTANGASTLGWTANVNDNLLINGDMSVWQRDVTFNSSSNFKNSNLEYTADAWMLLSDTNNVISITKDTTLFSNPTFSGQNAMRWTIVNTGHKAGHVQFMEANDYYQIAGQTVSFSFAAKGTNIANLRVAVLTWTGAANILNDNIISAWGAVGVNPTFAADWNVNANSGNFALGSSMTRFKLENISLNTPSGNNLAVFFWMDDTAAIVGATATITDLKLEVGTSCTRFCPMSYDSNIKKCLRRFKKDLAIDTPVFTPTIESSSSVFVYSTATVDDQAAYMNVRFDTPMLRNPTVVMYPFTTTTNLNRCSNAAGTDAAANSAVPLVSDTTGFVVYNDSGGTISLADGQNGMASTAGFMSGILHWYCTADL